MSEKNKKEMVKIVITRSVMGKLAEGEKLRKLDVGNIVTMQRLYADELISIRKAVLFESAGHEAFIEREKAKAISKKADPKTAKLETKLAEADDTIAVQAEEIAELKQQIAELAKPLKK